MSLLLIRGKSIERFVCKALKFRSAPRTVKHYSPLPSPELLELLLKSSPAIGCCQHLPPLHWILSPESSSTSSHLTPNTDIALLFPCLCIFSHLFPLSPSPTPSFT
ncbi:hypothetical protein KIL84_006088 [Mauremys mutica]|uniref:Uncharacterized protein n=1 Tax=Mauremys mutica TaxID=74926 RepID=A0A9D3XIM6_9SAUR|nr:hypothetical protein KIL84_006088 [Mauremys mutica]